VVGATKWFEIVRLRVDGSFTSRTWVVKPSGEIAPARARVFFVQNGAVVHATPRGEGGVSQATRLAPGVYSVMAAGHDGIAVIAVRVLPYEAPDAKPRASASQAAKVPAQTVAFAGAPVPPAEEGFLDIPLIPRSDLDALQAVLGEEVPGMGAAVPPGAAAAPGVGGGAAGGAGAAGGGLGALAGLAGLAGVAGAAGGGAPQASPKAP
jgi:hypothetical protein